MGRWEDKKMRRSPRLNTLEGNPVQLGREVEKVGMNRKKDIKHFRDLEVYKRAFAAAMEIFIITKTFPAEEKYSLVDQIRRASRSVCANLARLNSLRFNVLHICLAE
jgi:hypothetical protein